jgi:hypothetical protein
MADYDPLTSAEARLKDRETILRTGGASLDYPQCKALLNELEELREIADRYDNVMSTMSVDYEDMFPEESND